MERNSGIGIARREVCVHLGKKTWKQYLLDMVADQSDRWTDKRTQWPLRRRFIDLFIHSFILFLWLDLSIIWKILAIYTLTFFFSLFLSLNWLLDWTLQSLTFADCMRRDEEQLLNTCLTIHHSSNVVSFFSSLPLPFCFHQVEIFYHWINITCFKMDPLVISRHSGQFWPFVLKIEDEFRNSIAKMTSKIDRLTTTVKSKSQVVFGPCIEIETQLLNSEAEDIKLEPTSLHAR